MSVQLATPRYSAEDFETLSLHSAAPSYNSEVPSYHSSNPYPDPTPAYTPRTRQQTSNVTNPSSSTRRIGLPPIPSEPSVAVPNIHNFRIPTWSMQNAPAARQYQSVINRRYYSSLIESSSPYSSSSSSAAASNSSVAVPLSSARTAMGSESTPTSRPLEDPYLVGEAAAAAARRERIAKERGEDILIREDQQWDWLLERMKDWDQKEKQWAKARRDVDSGQRKKLLRRIGRFT